MAEEDDLLLGDLIRAYDNGKPLSDKEIRGLLCKLRTTKVRNICQCEQTEFHAWHTIR